MHPAMLIYLDGAVSTKPSTPTRTSAASCSSCTPSAAATTTRTTSRTRPASSPAGTSTCGTRWAPSYQTGRPLARAGQGDGLQRPERGGRRRDVTRRYLTYLAHHPATAQRIARKLRVKFVSRQPAAGSGRTSWRRSTSPTTPPITPVLRALVALARRSQRPVGSKVRDPGEDIVATYRALGVKVARRPQADPRRPRRQRDPLADRRARARRRSTGRGPTVQPIDNASWSSPSRLVASLDVHYAMSGGWWPTRDRLSHYRKARRHRGLPKRMKRCRFDVLVDHLSPRAPAPAADAAAAQGVLPGGRAARPSTHDHRRPPAGALELPPAAVDLPRLPHPHDAVTSMTTPIPTPDACCAEYAPLSAAAASSRGALALAGATTAHRLRGRHRLAGLGGARPRSVLVVLSLRGPPTGSPWSCRTATPPTTPPAPHRRAGRPAAGQGRHSSASTPSSRRCCRCGRRGELADRPRRRAAGRQPLALRGHGGARGRRPRLDDAQGLAQPLVGTTRRQLAAAGLQRGRRRGARPRSSAPQPVMACRRRRRGADPRRRPMGRRRPA